MAVNCPHPDCAFSVPEGTDPVVVAALLNGHMLVHSQIARPKPTPVRRPEISAGGTTEGWQYFLTRWRAYSTAVRLVDKDVSIQLLECLDPNLRRDVTRNAVGPTPIEEFTEVNLLAAIRALAVREENPKVARVALSRMVQDRGEPIRSFAARLRGQAEVCMFTLQCPGCDRINNQGEQRVADQLCIGLSDPEIQQDLLKDPNQAMSVEETIRFVEIRAAGKRSAVSITSPTSPASAIDEGVDQEESINSGYRQRQRTSTPRQPAGPTTLNRSQPTHPRGQQSTPTKPIQNKGPPNPSKQPTNAKAICCFCGRQGHGERSRTAIRRQQCPAFGSTCSACNKPNHYAALCWQNTEHESAIRESVDNMNEGTLPHQSWDPRTATWVTRRSPPQPILDILVSTHREDYQSHGHTLRKEKRNLATTALADTGCQSCLAGPALQKGLCLSAQDLIPTSLSMNSASGHPLPILGAALIRLTLGSSGRSTRQMVYFSPKATKLYLSLATCTDLGLIGSQFSLGIPPHPVVKQPIQPASQVHDSHHQPLPAPTPSPGVIQGHPGTGLSAQQQTTRPPPPSSPGIPPHPVVKQPIQPVSQVHDSHHQPLPAPTPSPGVTRGHPGTGPSAQQQTTRPPPPSTLGGSPNPHKGRPCSCPQRAPPPEMPTSLPFPGTEENRHRLERFLLDHYAASSFNVCEHQPLPMMSGPPLSLTIDPNATPKPCHTPITVPIHWQDEVKAGLDRDVRLGVLEEVPLGTPVTWCHRMVICTKKDGSLRRTINFQPLNRHATRETHHCPSPFHQARAVPRLTKKTVFDAWNGYHSVALDERHRHFTTFITPWGRYRYRTAPQGYIASGDAYTARYDSLVAHVGNKTKCIDDALLWSETIEEAFHRAVEWLQICATNGITLNPRKFHFAEDEVEFAGFMITPTGVRPADKFTAAVKEFPTPKCITDIRAWFGLVNQVSYAFSMTAAMTPFRHLLKPSTPFLWTDQLAEALAASKNHICSSIEKGVQIFDKGRPTCLATDWSREGMGFWLTQKHCRCQSKDPFCCRDGWRIVLVGSRFTHAAESRYAPVEGEALAVADALDKARHFVLGCSDLVIAVDHKPLLKLFGDRCLEDIPNPRLRNLKEKTLRYRFRMVYIPGARNQTSDALSRHPSGSRAPPQLHLPDDIPNPNHDCPANQDAAVASVSAIGNLQNAMCAAISSIPIDWEQLQVATTSDPSLQDLMFCIEEGITTDRSSIPASIQAYWTVMGSLSIVDDVICMGDRIVIPTSLRPTCLEALHAAHQGITGMTARAKSSIYWPGITTDIRTLRERCSICNSNAPSQPPMPSTTPVQSEYPFQHICADFFHHQGSAYLVLVDRYSGWPIVSRANNGAKGLAATLIDTFATFGIPTTLTSDGGPEFSAQATLELLTSWGITHRVSSAYFPHANNRAETGVKTVKRLIAGNTGPGGTLMSSFHKALLVYRNSPSPDTQMSPAMCLFGRPTRDLIPSIPSKLTPPSNYSKPLTHRRKALAKRQSLGRERWDEHAHGLSPLKCGDRVMVQNQTGRHPTKWDKSGVVTQVLQYHQYRVTMDASGRPTTRNRRFLRRNTNPPPPTDHPLLRRLPENTLPTQPLLPDETPPIQPTPGTPRQPHHQPTPVSTSPPYLESPKVATPTAPVQPSPPATTDRTPAPAAARGTPPNQGTTHPTTHTPKQQTTPSHTTPSRSYAAVAGTPTPPHRPSKPAPKALAHLPPYQPPLRRSIRERKPVDRL